MRINNFRILILFILSLLAFAKGFHCVRQNFNDLTSGGIKEKSEGNKEKMSQDEMVEAGLLKYAGVFGGPSDYSDMDDSGRSRRVKRYKT